MNCSQILLSRHAFERMFKRAIPPSAVTAVVEQGEAIAVYPDDTPFPSRLLLGFDEERPLHVVVAQDPQDQVCYVVTVYVPDAALWDAAFKQRKPR